MNKRTLSWRIAVMAALVLVSLSGMAQDDLIRLIPPGATVLAGQRQSSSADDVLWLVTQNNSGDLKQIVSLTENDPFARLDAVIVADYPPDRTGVSEHLLVADGRIDFGGIKTAGFESSSDLYQGIPILKLRRPGTSTEASLAVIHGTIALYGSPAIVRSAVDRYVQRAPADALVADRVKSFDRKDDAWSSMRLEQGPEMAPVKIQNHSGALLTCGTGVREADLGLRRGSKVSIELRAVSASGAEDGAALGCLRGWLNLRDRTVAEIQDHGGTAAVRLSLSRAGYEAWLKGFRESRTDQLLVAASARAGGAQIP